MKFKSQPNYYVRIANKHIRRLTGLSGIYFNKEGIYETDNEILIKALKPHFKQADQEKPVTKEIKTFHCKQCEYKTENRGDLLVHYRTDHPKEEGD